MGGEADKTAAVDDDDFDDTDADDNDNSSASAVAVEARPPPENPNPIRSSDPTNDAKRSRIEERHPPPASDESRRLFQRIWTDDEEIKILKRFFEFTSSRGTTFASHQHDTGPFYEQIKSELQLDFSKNQLIEKLRRLKKKYRTAANRMNSDGKDFAFRNQHEKAVYEIAKNIWSASFKKSGGDSDDDLNLNRRFSNPPRSRRRGRKRSIVETLPPAPPPPPHPPEAAIRVEAQAAPMTTTTAPMQTKPLNLNSTGTSNAPSPPLIIIEDTVKSCVSPIFKELLNSGLPLMNLGDLASDERWKKQQILELEVYLKRVELVRDQIQSALEELKGSNSQ